ncbi:anti-sigma factor [Phytohabitans houttuyneae]|uniref:Regulator of SigK n=1 Tax=Phytohabitans houttuyneae TaxID=1076126 RepID=A0A6V8KAD0_9ACTN|nr:anti-sigma factor [Phytohabitans houttuyneae]GFJ82182.1 hypothetical protein Phou_063620 [Phytohabitans houttuyneae]
MITVDVHALGGAYVLDAVSDLERAAFERHLTGCDACRTEVAELRETAARLADGAWSAPPPRLREQVLAKVRQTRQEPPRLTGPRQRRVGWRHRGALAAAAVALVAGGGVGGYLAQQPRVAEQRDSAQAAREQAAAIGAVLSAPDVRLRSGDRLSVAVSPSRDQAVVVAQNLSDAGPGRIHQLWLIRGNQPVPAGLLSRGPVLLGPVRGVDALAVTVEPAGGSRAPTSSPVAVVRLS